jgi:hypothetical protein
MGTLQLLSQSSISQSRTLEERLQYLNTFNTVLKSNSSVFSVGTGFPDGDVFIASLLDSDMKRDHFNAPEGTTSIALHVDTNDEGLRTMTSLFFDEDLHEVSRHTAETDFDTLQRPWYKQATDTPHATKPYLFHEIETVGLAAMVKTQQPGVVVALNVTLENWY